MNMTARRPPFVVWILVVAALARLAAAFLLPDQNFPDADSYRTAADEMRSFSIMGNPEIMPLYPALIALVGKGMGRAIADILLSVLSVWLVYAIAMKIYRDEAVAAAAAVMAALWPHFIFFAAVGLTETLFIALMLAALLCLYSERYLLGSVALVLSILTRPVLDPIAALLIVLFAMAVHRRSLTFAAKHVVVYAIVYLVLMAPWWAHNYKKYGAFVRLNNADGVVLYTGNNPLNRSGGGINTVDVQFESAIARISDPVQRNLAYKRAAIDYIRADPAHFLQMAAVKFGRLWRPWPYAEDYRNPLIVFISVASALPAWLLALYGLALSLRARWRELLPCFLVMGFVTLVHVVTIGSIRYRIPLEPFVLILAAAGLVSLLRKTQIGRRLLSRVMPDNAATVSSVT